MRGGEGLDSDGAGGNVPEWDGAVCVLAKTVVSKLIKLYTLNEHSLLYMDYIFKELTNFFKFKNVTKCPN